ncbi:ATP-dependent helicase HrpB [Pseudomonas sp. BAY1663]|jgi:ATP-dependent helicase HrpB|nr:ATP-dependent helicase HrpB [Pseudomonas sp. BAY1663]
MSVVTRCLGPQLAHHLDSISFTTAYAAIPSLLQALTAHDSVVLQAQPGAGKTARVSLALVNEAWLNGQSILMLQPRRVAARAAAERMASELGEKVGDTIGYRVRLENRVGPRTQIEVVTEGILSRRLRACLSGCLSKL